MSLQERYNTVLQDFVDRVIQEEDGSYSYYFDNETASVYAAGELEKLSEDIYNDVQHEATAYMSPESARACEAAYKSSHTTIFG